ncbi:MAG: pilus assembly protein PilM [Armatimonadota bacterium]
MRRRVAWGLDLGSTSVKLVRAEETPSGISFKCFGPVSAPNLGATPLDEEALRTAVSRILGDAGASRARIFCSIPRHRATIKFPEFPNAGHEQLSKMVRFEAQRYVPFSLEEVVLDFQELRTIPAKEAASKTQSTAVGTASAANEESAELVELLLAAVRKDMVLAYRRALASAGARVDTLSLGSLGTWDLYRHLMGLETPDLPVSSELEGEVVMLLDIGGQSTAMSVIAGGVLIFSRSTAVGSESLTSAFEQDFNLNRGEAEMLKRESGLRVLEENPESCPSVESWVLSLLSEIRRSAAAFTSEHRHRAVDRIYLCGGGAKLPGLTDYLAANLEMKVSLLPAGTLLPDLQFAEAAGQALRGLGRGASKLDLVPEEIEREKAAARVKARIQAAVAAVLALMALIAYFGSGVIAEHQKEQKALRELNRRAEAVVQQANRLQARRLFLANQLSALQEALYPQYPILDVIREISDRAPQGVWLTGITFEKGKPLTVRGAALSHTLAATYADELKRSPCFVEVNAGYSNEVTIGDKKIVQFSITGVVKGNEPKVRRASTTRTTATRAVTR